MTYQDLEFEVQWYDKLFSKWNTKRTVATEEKARIQLMETKAPCRILRVKRNVVVIRREDTSPELT